MEMVLEKLEKSGRIDKKKVKLRLKTGIRLENASFSMKFTKKKRKYQSRCRDKQKIKVRQSI